MISSLNPDARFVHLGKTAGRQHYVFDPLLCACVERPGRIFSRKDDYRQVDSLGQTVDRSMNGQAENLPSFWIDQEEFARIVIGEDILYYVISGLVGELQRPR